LLKDSVHIQAEKTLLHPRNPHRFSYNFKVLTQTYPELVEYVFLNQYGVESIDFANPEAVKSLNCALLKHFYQLEYWDIPKNFLCPPIPGRADYIHYLADLLATSNTGFIPTGKNIKVLDIGVGANCVYPIIGNHAYAWQFVGSDIDQKAIHSAQKIVEMNTFLKEAVECRWQSKTKQIFKGIIQPEEYFDLTLCNPPFHSSASEANAGTQRKWKNLGKNHKNTLNFGGQNAELWCEGGEETFVRKMIEESTGFAKNCFWFSSLISKKTTLPKVYNMLKKVKALEVKTIEMAQGQKISRILAWTFLSKSEQKVWQSKRW
jgi:23S rRNA (adenine1618-N6)-methyltransferase